MRPCLQSLSDKCTREDRHHTMRHTPRNSSGANLWTRKNQPDLVSSRGPTSSVPACTAECIMFQSRREYLARKRSSSSRAAGAEARKHRERKPALSILPRSHRPLRSTCLCHSVSRCFSASFADSSQVDILSSQYKSVNFGVI